MELAAQSAWIPWLVGMPLLAALWVPALGRRSAAARDLLALTVAAAALAGSLALPGPLEAGLQLRAEVPLMLGVLCFAVDGFSALFAIFSTFVWFCATLFAIAYFRHRPGAGRYHAASLATLGAQLGVLLAGDLLTLYLFFEALGLLAFLLVIHSGTVAARRAAVQYFWLTVLGGVSLLAGVMMVQAAGGGSLDTPLAALGVHAPPAAATLMVLGFGVKAGMVPLHVWLPNAHPVAPAPASALLSGVMIKAGAYGIFRSLYSVFAPADGLGGGFTTDLGLIVLWLGIATMAVGVIFALGQRDAKRMLAYHSISQMGFILVGFGAGAVVHATDGSLGLAGGLLHAANHAFFKACLFLGVGAVAFRAGTADMYALGGLWRRMPVTFACVLVASAGIAGLPLFNGFVSKCLVHHALVEVHALGDGTGLRIAEYVYMLVCAGTAASFIKLISLVFLGRPRGAISTQVHEAPGPMLLAMGLLCLPIVGIGLAPGQVLQWLLQPALAGAGLDTDVLQHYFAHQFLALGDAGLAVAMVGLGGAICFLGMRFGWFHLHLPGWMSLSAWLQRAGQGVLVTCDRAAAAYGRVAQRSAWRLRAMRRSLLRTLRKVDLLRRRWVEVRVAGLPGSRAQAFMEAAWIELEEDRLATAKSAVAAVRGRADTAAATDREGPAGREAQLEAARVVADALAGALLEARLEALALAGARGGADGMRAAFARLHRELPATRAAVGAAVDGLAGLRRRGARLLQPLHAVLDPLMAREARAMASPESGGEAPEGSDRVPGAAGAPDTGIVSWLRDAARLVAAELRQAQSAWPRAESFDMDPSVRRARRRLQRYARDPGLNVALTVLLMGLLAMLVFLGGRP
jgi:formate hydrogenlyase subunit 3/multisubunit Na+/H+ antiporter MnhD subunit